MKLHFAIADDTSYNQAENCINNGQNKFQTNNIWKMLGQQEIISRNIPVIKIGDSNIK